MDYRGQWERRACSVRSSAVAVTSRDPLTAAEVEAEAPRSQTLQWEAAPAAPAAPPAPAGMRARTQKAETRAKTAASTARTPLPMVPPRTYSRAEWTGATPGTVA